jgi:hypothetical protein
METQLPRVLGRPGALPVYAWVGADGAMRGVISFDGNPNVYPGHGPHADGSRYLEVFGREIEADVDLSYFNDSYEIEGDRVIRTRTVCAR